MDAEKHLAAVKHAVKQLVEEAVTRRFIHQDSANITVLCVDIDKALTFGLQPKFKRRWGTSSSADVLQHLGRVYSPAADLSKKCQEIIAIVGAPSGGLFFGSRSGSRPSNGGDHGGGFRQKLFANYSNFLQHRGHERFLWVRISLMEKTLHLIVESLVKHSRQFYERHSLMSHPVNGPIVASLLAGPCALDYSRMKTPDHRFVDPAAEDLILQDRIAGNSEHPGTVAPHSLEKSCVVGVSSSPTPQNKELERSETLDCINALHQNTHAALLYGKNNVLVETAPCRHVPGYLSVHQANRGLILKWTPNELVTGKSATSNGSSSLTTPSSTQSPSSTLTVDLNDVVSVHCHPYSSTGSTQEEVDTQRLQFILHDGTSLPPIGLQHGSTLFNFLATLETSLLPSVRLEPPLWGQHKDEGGVFAPPWPVSKQPSSPAFTTPRPPSPEAARRRSNSVFSGRRIEMSDFANSLRGASQFNARQRLERGCVFHLIRTCSSSPGRRSPSPAERHAPPAFLDDDDANVSPPGEDSLPSSDQSPADGTDPSLFERTESGGHRSLDDLSRLAMERMQERIKSRAFYGWLSYCRDMRIVRNHLAKLLLPVSDSRTVLVNSGAMDQWGGGLTASLWAELMTNAGVIGNSGAVMKYVLFGGIHDDKSHSLRKQVWPYLLGMYEVNSTPTQRTLSLGKLQDHYESTLKTWIVLENAIKESKADELEECEQLFADLPSRNEQIQAMWEFRETIRRNRSHNSSNSPDGEVSTPRHDDSSNSSEAGSPLRVQSPTAKAKTAKVAGKPIPGNLAVLALDDEEDNHCTCGSQAGLMDGQRHVDSSLPVEDGPVGDDSSTVITYRVCSVCGKPQRQQRHSQSEMPINGTSSPHNGLAADSVDAGTALNGWQQGSGPLYSPEETENWARELHKIDKDVVRCDRQYYYFVPANLVKLRNVVATYVWEHREVGYTQGMVDLLAPLMVVFDDEVIAYGCFCKLMDVMEDNFPHGKAMDTNFFNMRLLLEVYDRELFDAMKVNGDYTHLFFAYRWYLLDLKRELVYEDIFRGWESIWAARQCCTSNFTLFLCTSLVLVYRDVILKNNMGFTEIIKFFNDMAEKHRLQDVLTGARDMLEYLQQRLLSV